VPKARTKTADGSLVAKRAFHVAVCIDTRDGPGRDRLAGVYKFAMQQNWRLALIRQDDDLHLRLLHGTRFDGAFSNRRVLLGAVRRDSFKNKVTSQSEWGDYSATTWDGVTPQYKPDAPADYATLTYVPRDANGVATGPAVSADNSYNNLRNTRANFVSQRRISQDQPSVNFYNDYTVGSGRLKGLRLGAGVQYRGKQIVGYRAADTIVNPADPTRAIDNPNVDAYTAVFTPNSYHTVVATLGYTLRLKERRQVEFNLKLDNVLNSQGPLYAGNSAVLRPLGGNYSSPARETVANIYMLKQPISFMFTTTLKL
jgi:hypothetical protein